MNTDSEYLCVPGHASIVVLVSAAVEQERKSFLTFGSVSKQRTFSFEPRLPLQRRRQDFLVVGLGREEGRGRHRRAPLRGGSRG